MDKYQILSNPVENETISSLLKLWDNSVEHQFVPGLFSYGFFEVMNPLTFSKRWDFSNTIGDLGKMYQLINNAYQKLFVLDMSAEGIEDLNKILTFERKEYIRYEAIDIVIFVSCIVKIFYFCKINQLENAIIEINSALECMDSREYLGDRYLRYYEPGLGIDIRRLKNINSISDSALIFFKGYLYEQLKSWKDAYNCYGDAIEKFPFVPMYFWHFGMMAYQLGDKQNADKNLQRAIKLYKNYISNSQTNTNYVSDRHKTEENISRGKQFLEQLEVAYAQYSDDTEIIANDISIKETNNNSSTNIKAPKENLLQSVGNDEIKAAKIVSAYVTKKNANGIFLDVGCNRQAFMPKEEFGEKWDSIKAGDCLEVVLNQKEDGDAPYVKLVKTDKEKQVSQQTNNEKSDKANNEDKTLASNYINLGNYHKEQEKYEDAVMAYDKAIELDSTNYYVYVKRAEVKKLLNKHEEALADIEQAMFLNPQYDRAYSFCGDLMQDMGNIEDAVLDYGKAIEFNPVRAYAYAYAKRGLLFIKQQKYDMGVDNLKSAILFAPEWKEQIIKELQNEQEKNPEISKIIDILEFPNRGCNSDAPHGNQEIDLAEKQKDKSINSDNDTEDYF